MIRGTDGGWGTATSPVFPRRDGTAAVPRIADWGGRGNRYVADGIDIIRDWQDQSDTVTCPVCFSSIWVL